MPSVCCARMDQLSAVSSRLCLFLSFSLFSLRLWVIPSYSCTDTFFQNRFCSVVDGLEGLALSCCPSWRSEAWSRFRATRSPWKEADGVGGLGGGPGAVGWGRGVANVLEGFWRYLGVLVVMHLDCRRELVARVLMFWENWKAPFGSVRSAG